MRKIPYLIAVGFLTMASQRTEACSNVIVTAGASADGSVMVSYAADSHWLYGELYFHPAADHRRGEMLRINEWDTNKPLGEIPQIRHTFQTMGNMNEHQLVIGETTWGGREEQVDTTGIMDYGSLIYVTLQRASTARAAIDTIVSLANRYGYPSEGETFSIADKEEAWVMDIVGKGSPSSDGKHPGIVWVARRIPDGYICAHANQARITRFPMNDPENCLYAPDVVDYARSMGWYEGDDAGFSFREAYCPLDFGTVRGCDARAWSAFNILCDGTFTFTEEAFGAPRSDNASVTARPAADWLEYAMGGDLKGEMPLFVKPSRKISAKDVADVMRDHFEGTPMDMTQDIGAGGNGLPYRWRPMEFEYAGRTYVNERAIATQQTGFWFVSQSRSWLPDMVGALLWFGCDDAATSYLTPVYVSSSKVPECLRVGNGDLLHYSAGSQFWICNRVANACYKMYDRMAPVARAAADAYENRMLSGEIPAMDSRAAAIAGGKGIFRKARVRRLLTKFTVGNAVAQFKAWTALEELLLVKFIDGNVKAQEADGSFSHTKYSDGIPDGLTQPGYSDIWKKAVASDPHSAILEVKQ